MQWSNRMKALLLALPFLVICGCGQNMIVPPTQLSNASVFSIVTDAPLPSVVSCQLTITSVTLSTASTTTGNVLAGAAPVDFARLNGLHQLVDLSSVPTGTYTSATLMLDSATPSVTYIDTTTNPPTIHPLSKVSLSQTTVNVPLTKPFTLNNGDLVGLRMEFSIAKSLATDNTGQLTGVINPTFHMQLLDATDSNVWIDDFRGGVVGVTGLNTFVIQGSRGRQWTVTADNNTDFDTGEQIASFTTNTIVEVDGQINAVTKSIDATEISVVSNDKFVLGGLFTSIRPSPGAATAADLYVRSELPDINGVMLGNITTLNLNGTELYRIANLRLPFTTLLFNNSALTPGQAVTAGGVLQTSNGTTTLLVHRIVLQKQGQAGTLVPGKTVVIAGNNGSFELTDNSPAGLLLPSPLTVLSTPETRYINLNGLSDLTGATALPLRVVGFILIDPSTKQPVMVAWSVEQLSS